MKVRWCIPLVVLGIALALTWAAAASPPPPGGEAEQMFMPRGGGLTSPTLLALPPTCRSPHVSPSIDPQS